MDRSRVRVGRQVIYFPTTVEDDLGAGPWQATIVDLNDDGTVDLVVDPPGATTVGAALADTLAGAIEAFADPPSAAEMAALRTLVNQLRVAVLAAQTRVNEVRTRDTERLKTSVSRGQQVGQFDVLAGPASV